MPNSNPYLTPHSDTREVTYRSRLPEGLAAALGVLLALFSTEASIWLFSQESLRGLLPSVAAPGTWEQAVTMVVPPLLLGFLAGLVTLPLSLSNSRILLLVAGPFFVLCIANNVALAAYYGWPPKPFVLSPLLWLYAATVPIGVFFGRGLPFRAWRAA